jgi:hypothetical protein
MRNESVSTAPVVMNHDRGSGIEKKTRHIVLQKLWTTRHGDISKEQRAILD